MSGTNGEARALAAALRRAVRGEVRFDGGSRALYATDLSIYRQVPIGVVVPRDVDDAVATVAVCRRFDAPILARGCGTSLLGQCCNVAVVIDFSKHVNRIAYLDSEQRLARVEPGVICDQLRDAAKERGLTFAPDPATHAYCTLGGMIGNDSCGVHSIQGGGTRQNVIALDVLTYDGTRLTVGATSDAELARIIKAGGRRAELYAKLKRLRARFEPEIRTRYPRIPRRVSGYNLDQLLPENGFDVARALVGTEGTCVVVLGADVRLLPDPPSKALVVIGFPDLFTAADHVPELRALAPSGLEAVHSHVVENLRKKHRAPDGIDLLPGGDTWLFVELAGDSPQEAAALARLATKKLRGWTDANLFTDEEEQNKVWKIREGCIGASRIPGFEESWPGFEDAAVAPERLGRYLRDFTALVDRFGYRSTIFGHFGDGCVHSRITFDLESRSGVETWKRFMVEAADLVIGHGGSLSGEHGTGQAQASLLPRMYGDELVEGFRRFKAIWDPAGRMNPGKVVDAYPIDANLRVGPDHERPRLATHFSFHEDQGSFARATERCFGIGKCRALEGGTMCPSFRATREEQHTTRGRAHLLFEMLRGDAVKDGWKDEKVKEALDLCLACKGCKGDCPVQVDIATYKAEFLAHYYEGRVRPRSAYAMGLIDRWADLAARAPSVVNFLSHAPGLDALAKVVAGVASERELPRFAPETFREWFARRPRAKASSPRVLLFTDTFNDHFFPRTLEAATTVLEAAGFRVEIPEPELCCGRPLYDFGMLDRAKAYLARIVEALRPALAAGVPIVVLEPSCLSVFKDELPGLLTQSATARRLTAQALTLAELLESAEWKPPRLERRALLQGHCHHKAVLDMKAEERVLRRMGLDLEVLDAGCCGLAGSFGYEKSHYDVSMKIGELALFPKIRAAASSDLVVADGFSCREQIEHGTGREALHTAEVLALALDGRAAPGLVADARGRARRRALWVGGAIGLVGLGVGVRHLRGVNAHR